MRMRLSNRDRSSNKYVEHLVRRMRSCVVQEAEIGNERRPISKAEMALEQLAKVDLRRWNAIVHGILWFFIRRFVGLRVDKMRAALVGLMCDQMCDRSESRKNV